MNDIGVAYHILYGRNGGNISPIFFFARISQSLEVILIPICRFLLMMPNT